MRLLPVLLLPLPLGIAAPSLAQRTTNNAVTASDDAFGRAVGSEKIGIYSSEDVRGFNPVDAGNVRMEGLTFDQQAQPSNRLVDSSAIRVGYAARGYPFPAPTGIVDLKLEKYEQTDVASIEIESDDQGNVGGSILAKFGIGGDRFGIALGQGARISRIPYGRFGNFNSQAITLSWYPETGSEVTAYWSEFASEKLGASPFLFPVRGAVPPKVDRRAYFGQSWAKGKSDGLNEGIIAKHSFGPVRVEAGLFRSTKTDPVSFADLYLGTDVKGVTTSHVIVADDDNYAASTSGELRLSRSFGSGTVAHRIQLAVKARQQVRDFGGQVRLQLGAAQFGVKQAIARPAFTPGANDRSKVRQVTFGLGYDLIANGRGSLSLAVQKSDYRKDAVFANPLLSPVQTRDKPLLYSANGTVNLSRTLVAYAGTVRGLEESALAPDIATNRGEAPPAIRTSQQEAGLHYAITPKLAVVAGVFQIRKPYFNLDAARRFGQLGVLTNRGIEVSLAGTLAPGLTVVAGSLFLDPKISGAEVAAGRIGERPVGSFRQHAIANFDWRPDPKSPWSFDMALEHFSRATADAANSFTAPSRETLGLGTRYRFAIGSTKLLARLQLMNILNDYGYKVGSSGAFSFTTPRTAIASIAADF